MPDGYSYKVCILWPLTGEALEPDYVGYDYEEALRVVTEKAQEFEGCLLRLCYGPTMLHQDTYWWRKETLQLYSLYNP